jgi:hypothetical protein
VSATETERHRCEVRWCISRGSEWFGGYIKEVAKIRGKAAAQRLLRDVKEQAALGNEGATGDWRLPSMQRAV